MEIPAVVLAVLGALAGPVASVKVASLQAQRAHEDILKRLGKLEERLTAVEHLEPETQAKLRADLDALAADLSTVRGAVETLRASHEKAEAADEKRREKAAERAERRELREREQETTLAARLATVHTLLETLRQEIRDGRAR